MLKEQINNFKKAFVGDKLLGEESVLMFYSFLSKSGILNAPNIERIVESSNSSDLKNLFFAVSKLNDTQKQKGHLMDASRGVTGEMNKKLEKEKSDLFMKNAGEELDLEYFASKDVLADALPAPVTSTCIWTNSYDPQTHFKNPNFFLMKMVQKTKNLETKEIDRKVVGYVHVFVKEVTVNGKTQKVMFLPGINPTTEFMYKADAGKMLTSILTSAKAMAKEIGAKLAIPDDDHIYSNNPEIKTAITNALKTGDLVREPEEISEVVKWWGDHYPFNKVLWVK
jgi:hypothetical protein